MDINKLMVPPSSAFLTGRTALVTGGGRRLGRLFALALGGAGARVVVHCHTSRREAEATAGEIGEAEVIVSDLSRAAEASTLLARVAKLLGRPCDILVNNAALFARAEALETSAALWQELHAVNVQAPFLLSQKFVGQLPAAAHGDIINLNDARALAGDPDHFAYAASKVGLHGLTQNLARVSRRVSVNELALGAVLAPEGKDYLKTRQAELPSGEFPRPAEVATAMLCLLATPRVTGQTIWLDGGQFSATNRPR